MWQQCALCGAIVADPDLHATWHASTEAIRDDPDPMED